MPASVAAQPATGAVPASASSAGSQPLQELGQAAGQVDVPAVDVVERQRPAEEPLPLLGHGHPEEDPVEPGLPGVGRDALELERLPVRGVEAPADARAVHPLLQPVQVVVAEAEPAAHRLAAGQVEHLGRGDPGRGELEHLGQHAHHRVGLARERSASRISSVRSGSLDAPSQSPPAERRLNQRGEGLDVGAHHDDVAGLQRRVVLQQVQDGVAQHLDLAAPAVAGVHPDAVVVGLEQRPRVDVDSPPALPAGARSARMSSWICCSSVGRLRTGLAGRRLAVGNGRAEHELHLAGVAAPRLQQRVAGRCRRWGPRPGAGARDVGPDHGLEPLPQRRRRVEQEEVDVPALAHRLQHVEIAGRQPGQPEQRERGAGGRGARARPAGAGRRRPGARPGSAARSGPAAGATAPPATAASSRAAGPSAQRCSMSGRCTA